MTEKKSKLQYGRGAEIGMTGFRNSNQWLFGTMLVSALISLIASWNLSWDAILLAEDPTQTLNCDLGSSLSCSKVALTWQASLLGFPNSFLGMVAEPVVITIAVAGMANVKFPRWFMFTANLVYLAGLIFAYWLFAQSSFVIGALCPWCLLITLGTTLVFFTLTTYNIRENNLFLPEKIQKPLENFAAMGGMTFIAVLLLVTITAIIVLKYGPYLFNYQ